MLENIVRQIVERLNPECSAKDELFVYSLLEKLEGEAYDEGVDQGRSEGYDEGYDEGCNSRDEDWD